MSSYSSTQDFVQRVLSTLDGYKKESKSLKQQVAAGNTATIKLIVQSIATVFQRQESTPTMLLNSVRAIKEAMDTQNSDFLAHFVNSSIIQYMFEIALFRSDDQNEDRGELYFAVSESAERVGQDNDNDEIFVIGNSLLRIVLECFMFWPLMFPDQGNFADIFEQLSLSDVKFPTTINYFKVFYKSLLAASPPNSNGVIPFELSAKQQQKIRDEQQKKEIQLRKQSVEQRNLESKEEIHRINEWMSEKTNEITALKDELSQQLLVPTIKDLNRKEFNNVVGRIEAWWKQNEEIQKRVLLMQEKLNAEILVGFNEISTQTEDIIQDCALFNQGAIKFDDFSKKHGIVPESSNEVQLLRSSVAANPNGFSQQKLRDSQMYKLTDSLQQYTETKQVPEDEHEQQQQQEAVQMKNTLTERISEQHESLHIVNRVEVQEVLEVDEQSRVKEGIKESQHNNQQIAQQSLRSSGVRESTRGEQPSSRRGLEENGVNDQQQGRSRTSSFRQLFEDPAHLTIMQNQLQQAQKGTSRPPSNRSTPKYDDQKSLPSEPSQMFSSPPTRRELDKRVQILAEKELIIKELTNRLEIAESEKQAVTELHYQELQALELALMNARQQQERSTGQLRVEVKRGEEQAGVIRLLELENTGLKDRISELESAYEELAAAAAHREKEETKESVTQEDQVEIIMLMKEQLEIQADETDRIKSERDSLEVQMRQMQQEMAYMQEQMNNAIAMNNAAQAKAAAAAGAVKRTSVLRRKIEDPDSIGVRDNRATGEKENVRVKRRAESSHLVNDRLNVIDAAYGSSREQQKVSHRIVVAQRNDDVDKASLKEEKSVEVTAEAFNDEDDNVADYIEKIKGKMQYAGYLNVGQQNVQQEQSMVLSAAAILAQASMDQMKTIQDFEELSVDFTEEKQVVQKQQQQSQYTQQSQQQEQHQLQQRVSVVQQKSRVVTHTLSPERDQGVRLQRIEGMVSLSDYLKEKYVNSNKSKDSKRVVLFPSQFYGNSMQEEAVGERRFEGAGRVPRGRSEQVETVLEVDVPEHTESLLSRGQFSSKMSNMEEQEHERVRRESEKMYADIMYPVERTDYYRRQEDGEAMRMMNGDNVVMMDLGRYQDIMRSMSVENLNRLKKACLAEKTLLFENDVVKVGVVSSQHIFQARQFLKVQLHYFGKSDDISVLNELDVEYRCTEDTPVWSKPENTSIRLSTSKHLKQELIIDIAKVPYDLIRAHLTINSRTSGSPLQFDTVMPMTLNRFIEYQHVNSNILNKRWNDNHQFSIRSQSFEFNTKVLKNAMTLLTFFKYCVDLAPHKRQEYLAGLSDFKIGGIFSFQQVSNVCLMLKITATPFNRIQIHIAPIDCNPLHDAILKPCYHLIQSFYFLLHDNPLSYLEQEQQTS